MAQQSRLLAIAALFLTFLFALVAAHPGEHHDKLEVLKEMKKRGLEALDQSRELAACQNEEHAKARSERAEQRRAATVSRLRKGRGLEDGWSPGRGE